MSPPPNEVKTPDTPEPYQTQRDGSPLLRAHPCHNPRGSCSLQPPTNPCAATADCLTYKSPTSCCWHWELLHKKAWQLGEPGTRVSSHSGHTPHQQSLPWVSLLYSWWGHILGDHIVTGERNLAGPLQVCSRTQPFWENRCCTEQESWDLAQISNLRKKGGVINMYLWSSLSFRILGMLYVQVLSEGKKKTLIWSFLVVPSYLQMKVDRDVCLCCGLSAICYSRHGCQLCCQGQLLEENIIIH